MTYFRKTMIHRLKCALLMLLGAFLSFQNWTMMNFINELHFRAHIATLSTDWHRFQSSWHVLFKDVWYFVSSRWRKSISCKISVQCTLAAFVDFQALGLLAYLCSSRTLVMAGRNLSKWTKPVWSSSTWLGRTKDLVFKQTTYLYTHKIQIIPLTITC